MTEFTSDAIVVGAGVAGLSAARILRRRGMRVDVLEAETDIGGQVRGVLLDGLDGVPVDIGAEAFAVRGLAVSELINDLGLTVVEPAPLPSWCYAAGKSFPLPKGGVLGIPGDPWAPDVRQAIGFLGSLRASMDRFIPQRFTDTSTLDAFARGRMGSRVTERLVAPVATGVYSAPLDRIDIDAVSPGLKKAYEEHRSLAKAVTAMRAKAPSGSAVRGIDGGMNRLTATLADYVTAQDGGEGAGRPGRVLCSHEVIAIDQIDGGWKVSVRSDDGGSVLSAPKLLVTTPTMVDLVTPLVGHMADLTPDPQPGADIRLMTLLLRAPELDDAPRGTGMLIAPPHRDAGRRPQHIDVQAKAMTHSTAKWLWLRDRVRDVAGPGHHVVRLSYGRFGVTKPPSVDQAVADASTLFGVDLRGRVLSSLATHWDRSMPPPTPAYRKEVAAFTDRVKAVDGLDVTGGWIAGTGLAAIISHARETAERL